MAQGLPPGSCAVELEGRMVPACEATLRLHHGWLERRIESIHLSRPEHYLSICQSGCNLSCRSCPSWAFTKHASGRWFTIEALVQKCLRYEQAVTLAEPRERATAWHAATVCHGCGACMSNREPPDTCPGILDPGQITLSPQGFGPARNIVALTGGDLTCRPRFYEELARELQSRTLLWLLIETNGLGLTRRNLDRYQAAGVDSFCLDIKAADDVTHRSLTGVGIEHQLRLPSMILQRGFVLEVQTLVIPGLVEIDQLSRIYQAVAAASPNTPFTIRAFAPDHLMRHRRPPTVEEMLSAYDAALAAGLRQVRLANLSAFARTEDDRHRVLQHCN
jgi:pyruvate-formate lyase-activating enzyme